MWRNFGGLVCVLCGRCIVVLIFGESVGLRVCVFVLLRCLKVMWCVM